MGFFRKTILSCLLLLPFWLGAQGFTIEHFDVQLEVQKTGAIKVTETIDCNFTSSKHGIFRDIPFKYTVKEVRGEKALNRGFTGSTYFTYLDEISVEEHDYVVEEKGMYQRIKIGSASKYVSGLVQYKIKYTVYGAINQFQQFDEIFWNLTGNGWPVTIKNLSYSVKLPKAVPLGAEDLAIYTGHKGSREQKATISHSEDMVTGATTAPLTNNQGATIGIRLPKGMLDNSTLPLRVIAQKFIIQEVKTRWDVQPDGSILVKEKIIGFPKNNAQSFAITLNNDYYGDIVADAPDWLKTSVKLPEVLGYQIGSSYVKLDDPWARPAFTMSSSRTKSFTSILLNSGYSDPDIRQEFDLEYTIYGGVLISDSTAYLHANLWGGATGEPVGKLSLEVFLPGGRAPSLAAAFPNMRKNHVQGTWKSGHTAFEFPDMIKQFESVNIAMAFPGKGMEIAGMPLSLQCEDFYYDKYALNLDMQSDGWIAESHDFTAHVVKDLYSLDHTIKTSFNSRKDTLYALPRVNLFPAVYEVVLKDLESPQSFYSYDSYYTGTEVDWDIKTQPGESHDFQLSFARYGLIKNQDEGQIAHFPLIPYMNEPVSDLTISIKIPEGVKPDEITAFIDISLQDTLLSAQPMSVQEGKLVWSPRFTLQKNMRVDARIMLPPGSIGSSFLEEMKLLVNNNLILFLPLFILFPFFLLWVFFGRDRKTVEMVHFAPPKGMTPAEAGMLIDNKLHNRDIISLIYYWANNGNISIREEATQSVRLNKKEYYLKKEKRLPASAKKFERTLFKALFPSFRDEVKVSSLSTVFYSHMHSTRRELESYAKTKRFFVPGTRGFASFLKFLTILVGLATLVAFGFVFLFGDPWMATRYDFVIAMGTLVVGFYVLSRIMPKRGPYGQSVWRELRGFREFILRADKDRLKKLVDEDPSYFGHTLSYAIAFGLADQWAEKFEGLFLPKPTWYKTSGNTDFEPTIFTRSLMGSLYSMNRNFTSMPAPSGGSGGSSYSSGGSSFSSSSSFGSSGGSFSSGSSGGGFGGGGGGSW